MIIIVVIFLWILPILVGWQLGVEKGRRELGIGLSIFLGWIGVIALAFVPVTPAMRRIIALEQGSRACPFCQELVRAGAVVCPHCQRELPLNTGDHT